MKTHKIICTTCTNCSSKTERAPSEQYGVYKDVIVHRCTANIYNNDPVTGAIVANTPPLCSDERAKITSGHCGPAGDLWMPLSKERVG